jgi:HEAT repeat protein
MMLALRTTDPDERRMAVAKVVKSDEVSSDWAIEGLGAIARTDPNTEVRCVAIRGLQRSARTEAIETLLLILHASEHTDHVAPPAPDVRRAAIDAVHALCSAGRATDEQHASACETLMSLLTNDRDRHVRLSAARALRIFYDTRVLRVLVAALRDEDFGVAYAAERSLDEMTGMDLGYDVETWRAWLEEADEPFAKARPAEPAPRRWWQR